MFCKKRCSRKFAEKFPNCSFIKNETPIQVFPSEIFEIFKNINFIEHLRTTATKWVKIDRSMLKSASVVRKCDRKLLLC